MTIKHACFISYAHSKRRSTGAFIEQLEEAVNECLDARLEQEVYVDENRLKPGFRFNEALAEAICSSVCMITVLSPLYTKSEYCQREYAGMHKVDKFRREKFGIAKNNSFIIPVIYAGRDEDIPQSISQHIHYCDFRKFRLGQRRMILNNKFRPKVRQIADEICNRYRELTNKLASSNHQFDCSQFQLPTFQSENEWLLEKQAQGQQFPGRVNG